MANLEEGDHRLFARMRQDGRLTAPVSTYMTLGAGSPWAKIVPAGSYSRRSSRTPVQSTASMGWSAGGIFDLLIARRCTGRSQRPPEHSLSPNAACEDQKARTPSVRQGLKGGSGEVLRSASRVARLPWNPAESRVAVRQPRRRNRDARQIDREDATSTRKVARIDAAIVRLSAPPAEGETKTHARAVGAALLERTKELVDIGIGETAALILDLDEHALGAGLYPEGERGEHGNWSESAEDGQTLNLSLRSEFAGTTNGVQRATVVALQNSQHDLHLASPDEVAAEMQRWLADLPERR
jgi:hypothetical protein